MRIYLRELKANFKSVLIYIGVVAFFVVVGFSKFSAYAENPEILEVLDAMPAALLESFNMNAFNLTTVEGFFGVMYAFVGLILPAIVSPAEVLHTHSANAAIATRDPVTLLHSLQALRDRDPLGAATSLEGFA